MKIRIVGNYKAAISRGDGYGTAALEFINSLLENNFTDFTLTQAFAGEWHVSNKIIQAYENKNIDYDINLIILTADNIAPFFVEGRKNVIYTMYECDSIPNHWVPLCNKCDAVIVPSTFCRDVFKKSGVTVPIHIVPIPVNVNKFDNVVLNEELLNMTKDKLVFYSIFQWGERKNPTAMLNSYYSSFGSNDDVVFILKTHINGDNKENITMENKVRNVRVNIKRNTNDYPIVVLISNNLNDEQIAQIHKVGDVFLSSTRGEGFLLPALDGALIGNHVIATNFSSHTDFIDTYNLFKYQIYDLVDYQLEHCHSSNVLYTSDQKWASVNVFDFSNKMKKCYEDWKKNRVLPHQEKRDVYSAHLKTYYSYSIIGKKLLAILQGIA